MQVWQTNLFKNDEYVPINGEEPDSRIPYAEWHNSYIKQIVGHFNKAFGSDIFRVVSKKIKKNK